MLVGNQALEASGTLEAHSDVFQAVANEEKSVIASRAVGKYATGLLREGYSTKGFHNKAKSCNWGPMAGFVLSDPRFTKRGGSREDMEGQRRDLFKAFKDGATEFPVYISEARRQELLTPPLSCMRLAYKTNVNNHYYFATSPSGALMMFHLERKEGVPGSYGKLLWAVQYAYTESALPGKLDAPSKASGLAYLPVMAVVDTAAKPSAVGTYLSATTGDYDLFAVFPARRGYEPQMEERMVPGSARFQQPISAYIKSEDKHQGNLTPRIKGIITKINDRARHAGGNIVHHSDEAGRPMVNDIDFPFIAWVPGEKAPRAVRNVGEFKEFIKQLNFKYVLALNPGWLRELGFGVSGGGSYEA